jgi:hypothetical protein
MDKLKVSRRFSVDISGYLEAPKFVDVIADISIDVEAIAGALARKAVHTKSGKATGLGGKVVVKTRIAKEQPEEQVPNA